MNNVSVLVGEELDFDMAWMSDELFEKDAPVAKGGLRFRLRARKICRKLLTCAHNAHTPAAPARRRLDDHRVAEGAGSLGGLPYILDSLWEAWHRGNSGCQRKFLGLDLIAHQRDRRRIGADKDNAILF